MNLLIKRKQCRYAAALVLLLVSCACPVLAQVPDYITNSNLRGVVPFGSYQFGDIDSINLGNGALNLRIPLFSRRGRGLDYERYWSYSSKMWEVNLLYDAQTHEVNGIHWYPNINVTGWPGGPLSHRLDFRIDQYNCASEGSIIEHVAWNFVYTASDGSQYRFANRDYWTEQLTESGPIYGVPCGNSTTNQYRLTRSLSEPGQLELDTSGDGANQDYILRYKDGRQEAIPRLGGYGPSIKDSNGNIINSGFISGDSWEFDTVGRGCKYEWEQTSQTEWTATLTTWDSNGNAASYVFEYEGMTVQTAFTPSTRGNVFNFNSFDSTPPYTIGVLRSLTLPNGRAYTFEYDSNFAELTHIGLPTGGSIDYQYALFQKRDQGPEPWGEDLDSRRVIRRTVSDGVNSYVWAYDYYWGDPQFNWYEGAVTKVTDPEGNVTLHFFDGTGIHEMKTEVRQGSATPLRQVANTWIVGYGLVACVDKEPAGPVFEPRDWRIVMVVTTLMDITPNLISRVETDYDSFTYMAPIFSGQVPFPPAIYSATLMNPKEKREYGFDQELLRRTKYSYLHEPDRQPAYAQWNYHILDRLAAQEVYEGWVDLKAKTEFEYDSYAVTATSNVVQHDYANFGSGFNMRGNLTKKKDWLDGVWLTSNYWYDDLGNRIQSQDPRGKNIYFSYADSWKYSACAPSGGSAQAFVTQVTNALGHTVGSSYYACSSLVGSVTDANNKETTYSYDTMDRVTQIVRPDLGKTTYAYNDAPSVRSITIRGDLDNANDQLLHSEVLYDGLERTTETRQYEPNGCYIATKTIYDGLSRPEQVSNPYRPTCSESVVWTTTTYDALGRVTSITTPDGATAHSTYQGNLTTVRDPANKQRRSTTDALGRLITVEEMNEHPSTGVYAETDYGYDVLDKLKWSSQGLQTRLFDYDSLGRLTSAFNPESGIVYYQYDGNGNVTSRTDARGIATTYQYDDINRLTIRTYTDGTPAVTNTYDSADQNPIGRLTTVSSSISTYRYDQYNEMGQVTRSTQTTGTAGPYVMNYTYNLAGGMTSETYPSGRRVDTRYDTALRVRDVLAGSTRYAQSFEYAPHGAVKALQLGNGWWEHANFNTRLQPEEIGLGSSSGNSSLLRLTYGYGGTSNNGNIASQQIQAQGQTWTQNYTYDLVNRLLTAGESGNWTINYSYDQYGNRATAGYLPGGDLTPQNLNNDFNPSDNRLKRYTYDGAGNLILDIIGNTYAYDAENHMKSFNGTAGSYEYDGEGRRVKKTDATGTAIFVYDIAGRLVAEYSNAQPSEAGGTKYLTQDHLGSTRLVTDQTGAVVSRHDYLPFGEEILSSMGNRALIPGYGSPDGTRQRFSGKERDSESGLDYFLARYYSGAQGRFTSPDPKMISKQRMLDPQQWNMYEYARNNPLLFIDPDGAEIGYYYAPGGAMYSPYDPQFPKSAHPIRDTLILGAMTAGALLGPEGAAVARGLATSLLGWALGNPEKIQRAAENVADMVSPPGSPSLTSMAESFGFKSFREAGSMIGGELKGGGTALLSFSKSSETFGVNVSMVAGPAGTLSRLETGAIDAARAQGASILELKASMVKDSVGRLLRMNGFTQIMKDGKATGDWIKKINLLPQ